MTRAGEKLYGEWERRLRDGATPFRWRSLLKNAGLLLAVAGVLASAMFGFG